MARGAPGGGGIVIAEEVCWAGTADDGRPGTGAGGVARVSGNAAPPGPIGATGPTASAGTPVARADRAAATMAPQVG